VGSCLPIHNVEVALCVPELTLYVILSNTFIHLRDEHRTEHH
jgi:hypothetical protein